MRSRPGGDGPEEVADDGLAPIGHPRPAQHLGGPRSPLAVSKTTPRNRLS